MAPSIKVPLREWATASALILDLYIFIYSPPPLFFCFYGLALCVLVAMTTESCAWPRARMKEREREWLAYSDVEVDRGGDAIISQCVFLFAASPEDTQVSFC